MTRTVLDTPREGFERGSRDWLGRLLLDVRYGRVTLSPEIMDGIEYYPKTAHALIRAQRPSQRGKNLFGIVNGNLSVTGVLPKRQNIFSSLSYANPQELFIHADIKGGLKITGVFHRLSVLGQVHGDVRVYGAAVSSMWISNEVHGDVNLYGHMRRINGRDCGPLTVGGVVHGDLFVGPAAYHGDGMHPAGALNRLTLSGRLVGNLRVIGQTEMFIPTEMSDLYPNAAMIVMAPASYSAELGLLDVDGHVDGDISIDGLIDAIKLTGNFKGRITLIPSGDSLGHPTELQSVVGARFAEEVFVGDNVEISACDFRRCADLQKLNLAGADLFSRRSELANPPAGQDEAVPAHEMASIYRQLRANLETRKNRAASGKFYRGEMSARLEASRPRSLERAVLQGYKWMSDYGQSVVLPVIWFAVLSMIGALLFSIDGLDLDPTKLTEPADLLGTWTFAVRSMLSFFSPPTADLTIGEQWVQIALRFAGPILLAQFILAVREKVAR